MELRWLTDRIEKDFVPENFREEIKKEVEPVRQKVEKKFLERGYGTVLKSSEKVEKVFTAVYPSEEVIDKIIDRKENRETALLTHHPATRDITRKNVFRPLKEKKIQQMEENNISLITYHTPLDRYGQYSTSSVLATVIGKTPEKGFAVQNRLRTGVICQPEIEKITELKEKLENAVGHRTDLKKYGESQIERVGIVAGRGLKKKFLEQMVENGADTLVTGITTKNSHSEQAHRYAEQHGINILGGTHYSTEKFGMQKLCGYLDSLMVESEFLEDKPCMKDIK